MVCLKQDEKNENKNQTLLKKVDTIPIRYKYSKIYEDEKSRDFGIINIAR